MPAVVLTELLSASGKSAGISKMLLELPLINLHDGYWQSAGELRAQVLAKRKKARLGDALIAQSCIDAGIRLISRDHDFPRFAELAGPEFVVGPIKR